MPITCHTETNHFFQRHIVNLKYILGSCAHIKCYDKNVIFMVRLGVIALSRNVFFKNLNKEDGDFGG